MTAPLAFRAYGQEKLLDDSQLPAGALVCEACSWPSDEFEACVPGGACCSICGEPLTQATPDALDRRCS